MDVALRGTDKVGQSEVQREETKGAYTMGSFSSHIS